MDAKRSSVAPALLDWYDRHRRTLPWRSQPGETPDPYRVWVSEVMLQQTTVAAVAPRFTTWVARWPDVASLAAAPEADVMAAWAGLGYYARARNLVRAARAVVDEHGGRFPDTEAGLRTLPGLGAYTAAAVGAIAFGERAVVVDANVERVVARLFAIATPLPAARPAIRVAAETITPPGSGKTGRAGDFAQAMMDLGSGICTPRAPRCLLCPLQSACDAFATGKPDVYPFRLAKAVKPQRYGTVFWMEHERRVLLVRRPAKGLLGGMRALPTGPWAEAPPGLADAPFAGDWRLLERTVRHGFTHFDLQLALAVAQGQAHQSGEWWPVEDLAAAGLPTVFARAAQAIRSDG